MTSYVLGPLTADKSSQIRPAFPDCKDRWAVAILICGVALMFWKELFTSQMLFYRDILNQSYPTARLIHEICRQGFLPYWNPYLNFGQPILENPNSLFFYPSTLLVVLLPVDLGYTLHFVLHFMLAAVGTYCLARRWQQSYVAAFFAACFFVFSGPVLSLGSFYNEVACAAWIPWALLLTDCAVEGRSIRSWAWLTLVFLMQFLAGEPFTLLATFGLCFAYALFRAGFFRRPLACPGRRVLVGFVLSGCSMIALGAVQLFPAIILLRESIRGALHFPFAQMTYWSVHPLSLIEVVAPQFFGPMFTAPSLWTAALNFSNKPYFPSLFLGFVPVFFALISWTHTDRRRRFAAWAAMFLLALAFGRFTPLYRFSLWIFPVLRLVRFPIKLLIPVFLLVALLAGWGIDVLREPELRRLRKSNRLLLFWEAVTAALGLLWMISWIAPLWVEAPARWILIHTLNTIGSDSVTVMNPKALSDASHYFLSMLHWQLPGMAGFALGGFVWILGLGRGDPWAQKALPVALLIGLGQLVFVNYSANPTVPRSFYLYQPPVLQHFGPAQMPYRFCDIFGNSPLVSVSSQSLEGSVDFDSIPSARNLSEPALAEFQERLLLEHAAMIEKAEGISNVDPDWSFPVSLYQFWVFALHKTSGPAQASCLLGRTNVRYQILGARKNLSTLREVTPIANGSPSPSFLYENLCSVPRAYVANRGVHSPGADATLARMSDPDFGARDEVLLASKPADDFAGSLSGGAGTIESFSRQPSAVRLRAKLARPGYVVLLDRYDSNWHATLDGHEVTILRANHMFRAVQVDAGEHEIRLYYRQRGLLAGLLVSLAALVLVAILFLRNFRVAIIEPEPRDL